jgi:hypothetical protein
MSKRPILLVSLVAVALMFIMGVADAQLSAKDDPSTRGAADIGIRKCIRDRTRTTTGQVAVISRACSYLIDVKPSRDMNEDLNYTVFWFQANIEPKHGFCLTNIKSKIKVPDGYTIEGSAPQFVQSSERRKVVVKLPVKGGGDQNDRRIGLVKNSFGMLPGVLDPTLEDNKFLVEWDGETDQQAAIAIGIEVSWPADDPPARRTHGSVDSTLRSSC